MALGKEAQVSEKRFDAIVIGAGQAGPSMAGRLTAAGRTVAIVERDQFGGTCVNTGCTPTKTLVASAYAAHMARRASEYDVAIGGAVTVDWPLSGRARKLSWSLRAAASSLG
jgi:pyruvate/2-oxoglutarate dehydrogenase complex dihydrolipoamide dehydrogenase (E3) component